MKFDLEPGEKIKAGRREPRQGVLQDPPGRERHRLAVGEINIAEKPAGIWRPIVRAPRQHAERRRIGHHDEIAGALHLRHVEAAAGGEHRIGGLVRGVLGEKRRRHRDAAGQHGGRIGGDHGLAAQHAVLVGEGEAHQLELVLLDRLRDRLGLPRLLAGPKAVTLDKAFRVQTFGAAPSDVVSAHSPSSWSAAGSRRCAANSPASRPPDRCRRHRPAR